MSEHKYTIEEIKTAVRAANSRIGDPNHDLSFTDLVADELTRPKIEFSEGEVVLGLTLDEWFAYDPLCNSEVEYKAQPLENMSQPMRDLYEGYILILQSFKNSGYEVTAEKYKKRATAFEQHHGIGVE